MTPPSGPSQTIIITHGIARTVFVALTLALTTTAIEAQASDSSYEARKRNQCRLAAQVIETGQPAPKYDWSVSMILRCTEQNGPVLAAAWRSPPTDSTKLFRLMSSTQRLDDRTVSEAVLETARNAAQPIAVRFAAIVVLTTYADPTAAVRLASLADPGGGVVGSRVDFKQRPGAMPLTAMDREHVVDVLEEIGASDGDPSVRAAAGAVAADLRLRLGRASR